LQLDALKKIGCSKIFTDTPAAPALSGRDWRKHSFMSVKATPLLSGVLIGLAAPSGTSSNEPPNSMPATGFKSITEKIDTTTSGGKLVFHIFGALAEFERDLIRERTQAGLSAARVRGKRGGRPKVLTQKKIELAKKLYADKSNSIDDICSTLNISRATFFRNIKAQNLEPA
jgi:hypothetical protein